MLDLNELKTENERLSKSPGGDFLKNFVKLPEGTGAVVLRFLAPASGMFGRKKSPFYQWTRTHRMNNKSLHCPKVLDNSKFTGICSICDYYNWLWRDSEKKSPDEAQRMQREARGIKPIERYYYNVIVRQQVNEETQQIEKNVGPLILPMGKTLHKMIIRAIVGDENLQEAALGDVTHATKGRDFKLIKTMRHSGKESFPNYSDSKFLEVSPLGNPDEVERWKKELHDLMGLRIVLEGDELKKALKIHLGLIQDDSIGFDPREFQTSTVSTEEAVSVSSEASSGNIESSPLSEEVSKPVEDEVLADNEFLSELRNI